MKDKDDDLFLIEIECNFQLWKQIIDQICHHQQEALLILTDDAEFKELLEDLGYYDEFEDFIFEIICEISFFLNKYLPVTLVVTQWYPFAILLEAIYKIMEEKTFEKNSEEKQNKIYKTLDAIEELASVVEQILDDVDQGMPANGEILVE